MKFVIENLGTSGYAARLFGCPGVYGQGTTERVAIGDLVTKLCALRGNGWEIERRGEVAMEGSNANAR